MTTSRILASDLPDLFDEATTAQQAGYAGTFDTLITMSAFMAHKYREGGNWLSLSQLEIDWKDTEKFLRYSKKVFDFAHDNKVKGEYLPFDLEVLHQTRECCRMLGELRGIILQQIQRKQKDDKQRSTG